MVAAALRFWKFSSWSLHNDELSTIFRAKYDSLSQVIRNGVMTDVHPLLNELFIYCWMNLFGDSPFAVRFPYVLMGIAGLYFFYRFIRSVSGKTTAILSTTVLASTQLFVLYSQIARPYAMGFFLMMLFAYYWQRLINENHWKWSVIVGLIAALSSMTHYFLALSILLLYLIGIIWLLKSKTHWLKYFSSGIIALILFSPHLSITIDQIRQKGLGWLPTPKDDFFFDFIYFSLNESLWFILIVLLAPLIAQLMGAFRVPSLKEISLSLVFIISYLIGFYYSVNVEPVIQKSTLIFSFPLLLFIPFSFFSHQLSSRSLNIISIILLGLGTFSLIVSANFYGSKQFADFEKVAEHLMNWKDKYGANVTILSSANNPKYLNYYFDQKDYSLDEEMDDFHDREKIEAAVDLIRESKTNYLVLAFANHAIPAEIYEYARLYFPKLLEKHRYFNSEALLLSNEVEKSVEERAYSFFSRLSNRNYSDRWVVNHELFEDSLFYSAPAGFRIRKNDLYFLNYRAKVKQLFRDGSKWLTLRAKLKSKRKNGIHLVVTTERAGEQIDWRSVECDYYHQANDWYEAVFVYQIPESALPNDDLLVYFWNPKFGTALIDDVVLYNYNDSDFDYYQWP